MMTDEEIEAAWSEQKREAASVGLTLHPDLIESRRTDCRALYSFVRGSMLRRDLIKATGTGLFNMDSTDSLIGRHISSCMPPSDTWDSRDAWFNGNLEGAKACNYRRSLLYHATGVRVVPLLEPEPGTREWHRIVINHRKQGLPPAPQCSPRCRECGFSGCLGLGGCECDAMLAEPIQQQIQSLEAEYQVLLEKLAALPFPIGNSNHYCPQSFRNEDADEKELKRRMRSQALVEHKKVVAIIVCRGADGGAGCARWSECVCSAISEARLWRKR